LGQATNHQVARQAGEMIGGCVASTWWLIADKWAKVDTSIDSSDSRDYLTLHCFSFGSNVFVKGEFYHGFSPFLLFFPCFTPRHPQVSAIQPEDENMTP
jgi:hypothetical protein